MVIRTGRLTCTIIIEQHSNPTPARMQNGATRTWNAIMSASQI